MQLSTLLLVVGKLSKEERFGSFFSLISGMAGILSQYTIDGRGQVTLNILLDAWIFIRIFTFHRDGVGSYLRLKCLRSDLTPVAASFGHDL